MDIAAVLPARAARLLFQLPRDSRTHLALQPKNEWGWQEVLLNNLQYLLEVVTWQNANEGVKKSKQTPKPVPFVPDFMGGNVGKDAEQHDIDDIKNILNLPRE